MAKVQVLIRMALTVIAALTFIGSTYATAKVTMTVPKPMDEQTAFYHTRLAELLRDTEILRCSYSTGSGRSLRNRVTSVPHLVSSRDKDVQRILLRQPNANWSVKISEDGDVTLLSFYKYNSTWSASDTNKAEVDITDKETFVLSADGNSLKSFDVSSSRTEQSQTDVAAQKEFYRITTVQCPGRRASQIPTSRKLKVVVPAKHACDFSQFENLKDTDGWRALTAAKLWTKINQREEDIGTGAFKAAYDPGFLDSERGHQLGISFDMAQDDSPANLFSTCLVETGKDPRAHAAMFGDVKIAKEKNAGGFIVGIADPQTAGIITFVTPKNVYQLNRITGSLTVQNERSLKLESVDPRARRGLDRRLREFISKYPELSK
jgi:hypothetical protein